jgi:hypothetical protein
VVLNDVECKADFFFPSIMPGGVPHFVVGTSNCLCIGRHFYAESTIRSSVIAIAQTFVFGGVLTNDSNFETRTFLYQMLVFWSSCLNQTDIDGKFLLQR